jgi:hypothetical protein
MLGAKNASMESVWFMPSCNIDEALIEYDINYTADTFEELYVVLEKWATNAR